MVQVLRQTWIIAQFQPKDGLIHSWKHLLPIHSSKTETEIAVFGSQIKCQTKLPRVVVPAVAISDPLPAKWKQMSSNQWHILHRLVKHRRAHHSPSPYIWTWSEHLAKMLSDPLQQTSTQIFRLAMQAESSSGMLSFRPVRLPHATPRIGS